MENEIKKVAKIDRLYLFFLFLFFSVTITINRLANGLVGRDPPVYDET